jgi:hypothetical protein
MRAKQSATKLLRHGIEIVQWFTEKDNHLCRRLHQDYISTLLTGEPMLNEVLHVHPFHSAPREICFLKAAVSLSIFQRMPQIHLLFLLHLCVLKKQSPMHALGRGSHPDEQPHASKSRSGEGFRMTPFVVLQMDGGAAGAQGALMNEMGLAHAGLHISAAPQLLNGAQVLAVFQRMGNKG